MTHHSQFSALMTEAIDEACKTSVDVPVGCVIILDGQVIAKAHNEREDTNDPTAHAEILAIRKAAKKLNTWRLNGTILISTLEPCPMCAEAIIQARVSVIVFGAYDVKSGACGSAFNLFIKGRSYPLPEVIGGIEEESCTQLLENFFKNRVRQSKP